jgi:hypothetical protein
MISSLLCTTYAGASHQGAMLLMAINARNEIKPKKLIADKNNYLLFVITFAYLNGLLP